MMTTTDYYTRAKNDAVEMVHNFLDNIVEMLLASGEASDDLYNDYPDGDAYHHETHIDKAYNLTQAAQVLDDLSDYEETDSGLWHGLAHREAIGAQAAYTYGNAVYSLWRDLIEEINEDGILAEMIDEDNDDINPKHRSALVATRIQEIVE